MSGPKSHKHSLALMFWPKEGELAPLMLTYTFETVYSEQGSHTEVIISSHAAQLQEVPSLLANYARDNWVQAPCHPSHQALEPYSNHVDRLVGFPKMQNQAGKSLQAIATREKDLSCYAFPPYCSTAG